MVLLPSAKERPPARLEARDDLFALFGWIEAAAGTGVASNFIGRLEDYCRFFDLASERGARRDDIRRGLKVVGFERRIAIAFMVADGRVTIYWSTDPRLLCQGPVFTLSP